jgi:hypothetical protein
MKKSNLFLMTFFVVKIYVGKIFQQLYIVHFILLTCFNCDENWFNDM